MRLYFRLAWRNIWRHTRRTVIVVLAIGLVMALMMIYDGLIAGFEQAIYGNAIKVLGGNIQIHAEGYSDKAGQMPLIPMTSEQSIIQAAESLPQVLMASRRINTGGLATNREGAFPVNITAIEPEKEKPYNLVGQHVSAGKYLTSTDQDVLYIGQGLATAMDVKVGDRITLVGRAMHNVMRQHTFMIRGIYDLGMASLEKRTVYMPLAQAQMLYGLDGQSTEVAIMIKQIGQEAVVIKALQPALTGDEATSWQENFPEMQAALESKGAVMNIFSVVILIIAGIGILNMLLMAVYERTREIGLLGALGLRPNQIAGLFLLEGTLMGLIGLALGVALGLVINFLFGRVGMDFGKFTSMTDYMALITGRVYPSLGMEKLALRAITVLVISFLFSLIPAYDAAQNEPAASLHYV